METMDMDGAATAVASAEEGGSANGSVSPVLGTEAKLVEFSPEAADVEAGPGPDDYTQNPGYQESFVA